MVFELEPNGVICQVWSGHPSLPPIEAILGRPLTVALPFELASELADITHCHVDLLDFRAASTVMQNQILTRGQRLWAKDVRAGLFEAAMLNEKIYLHHPNNKFWEVHVIDK
jgi:hypothetical protein